MRKSFVLATILGLVGLLFAHCGEEREPHAGYSSPCDTPMGSVLSCPASSPLNQAELTIAEGCAKLVGCGLLADEYLRNNGNDCSDTNDCDASRNGKCITTNSGSKCHYPYLDYQWCVSRLTLPARSDPCDNAQSYSSEVVANILACVRSTPCTALGLNFSDKRVSAEHRPALDKYTCKDGKKTVWTASICDFGLLNY